MLHGEGDDHRVAGFQRVASSIAGLGLAAADVAAGGAHPEAAAAAAFLAAVAGGRCDLGRNVGAGGLRSAERSEQVHALMFA
jgi:hypothetical protein